MPPSSTAFSATIRPDPGLLRIVSLSGLGLLCIGLLVIAAMHLPVAARLGLAAAWLAVTGREIGVLSRAWRRIDAITVDAGGEFRLVHRDGRREAARLLPGSILLSDFGWLRIAVDGRAAFAVPIRGDGRQSHDWRRLQVIWRHLGASH